VTLTSTTLAHHPLRVPARGIQPGKYLAVLMTAFRQRREERATLVGRVAFYCIVLMIFARLWQAVFGAEGSTVPDRIWADYVWYLAMTEWIMLSQPSLHLDIEADVRSGDVAYHMARPISYVGSKLAEGAGGLVLRLPVMGVCGLLFARWFSGEWPGGEGLLLAVPVGLLASVFLLLSYAAIGLCAFWVHDVMPTYFIWQKLAFLLGGLMLPLSIYPEWLRNIALHTPFAAALYGPGQLIMHGGRALALRLSCELLGWITLIGLVVFALERRGRRAITLHGG
jgi:ABC-2 type transport system permease protein